MAPSFVDQLRREHGSATTDHHARRRRLYFRLTLDAPKLRVSLQIAGRQPNGHLDDPRPYPLQQAHLSATPPFLTADDVALLATLLDSDPAWAGASQGPVPTDMADRWLLSVVDSRRALDGQDRTLVHGDTVQLVCTWRIDETGCQQLRWQAPEGLYVLPTVPPLYWSTTDGRIGAVDTPYAEPALHWLPTAPRLAPADIADWQARHGERLASWGLPLPAIIPIRREAPQPTPRLSLDRAPASGAGDTDRLALYFEYTTDSIRALFAAADSIAERAAYAQQTGEQIVVVRDFEAEAHPCQQFRELVQAQGATEIATGVYTCATAEQWQHVMTETVPALQHRGWLVDTAPDFRYRFVRPERVDVVARWLERDWFDLALSIGVDGVSMPLLPLLAACQRSYTLSDLAAIDPDAERPIELADGRRLLLPVHRLRRWLHILADLDDGCDGAGPVRLPRSQLDRLAQLDDGDHRIEADAALIEAAHAQVAPVEPAAFQAPSCLRATLREYQKFGVAWLQQRQQLDTGGILADDMGLGKTLQVLAHIVAEREQGRLHAPALVVAPTSLLSNWRAEARRFCPDLQVCVLHGRSRHDEWDRLAAYDLLLTSYALLSRDAERWEQQTLSLAVLDEAHAIRNPATAVSRSARALDATARFCLTGTPLQNHLGELWALLDFVGPGLLGSERQFNRHYRQPIEEHGDAERATALMERVAPWLLRRSKDEVAIDLPAKSEVTLRIPLTQEQRDLYETVRTRARAELQVGDADSDTSAGRIHVLNALMQLRQTCCDPRLIDSGENATQRSAKREHLLTMLRELVDEGRTILVFSQFRRMLDLIARDLADAGIGYLLLTGATSERGDVVERFQQGEAPVFLISLKAGGSGLNLTRADTVIHYDPWWNRAAEDQATDRAHRIGQDDPVFVYRLIAQDTVEERVHALQGQKHSLLEQIYDAAEAHTEQWRRNHVMLRQLLDE